MIAYEEGVITFHYIGREDKVCGILNVGAFCPGVIKKEGDR